jgi:hypothetical protein
VWGVYGGVSTGTPGFSVVQSTTNTRPISVNVGNIIDTIMINAGNIAGNVVRIFTGPAFWPF